MLRKEQYIAVILIIIASAAVYFNSVKVPFIYDDVGYIVENLKIRQLGNIGTELIKTHRPLTNITFALNYYLGGLNTQGYHIFNVFIHIISAILLFFLTRKIFSYSHNKSLFLFPLFTSLVFACHPINTEVVTYIYNRSASLSTLFYLLSLLLFINSFEGKRNLYPLSVLSFVLSFLSKEMAITLPVMLLAFDYIFLSDFKISKVIEKKYFHIPFWIVSLILLLLQFYYFKPIRQSNIGDLWPGYSYYLTQPWIITKYLRLLLIPAGLCIDHQFKRIITITEYRAVISYIFILCIFIACRKLYKNRNNKSKTILFGIIWFFATLLPTNLFIVHIGERHLYLSGIGFYIVVSVLLLFVSEIYFFDHPRKFFVLLILPVIILGLLTVKRNKIYQNPILLWGDVLGQYPNNTKAYNSRGMEFQAQNNLFQALSDYNKALQINHNYIEAYYNRGNIYYIQGNLHQALSDCNRALQINPDYAEAYNNRGIVYQALGNLTQALTDFSKALQIDSNLAKAYNNRGIVYQAQGNLLQALSDYNKALQLDPDYAEAYQNRGDAYQEQGNLNQAIADYNKTIKIKPDEAEAYNNRGNTYQAQGSLNQALSDYNKALQINPNLAATYNNRAGIYYQKKEYDKSWKDVERAETLGYKVNTDFIYKLKKASNK